MEFSQEPRPNTRPEVLFEFAEQEDARKLHSEINQLTNQRFVLLTVSITVFVTINAGLVAALLKNVGGGSSSASEPAIPIGPLSLLSCAVQGFLFVLFYLGKRLRHISRCQATYLIANRATKWESLWSEFREDTSYSGLQRMEFFLFLFLLILQAFAPFLWCWMTWKLRGSFLPHNNGMWAFLLSVAFAVPLVVFARRTEKKLKTKEETSLETWKSAIEQWEKRHRAVECSLNRNLILDAPDGQLHAAVGSRSSAGGQ